MLHDDAMSVSLGRLLPKVASRYLNSHSGLQQRGIPINAYGAPRFVHLIV
jgi:hypothetical protein